jgi:hypothetical protein
VECIRHWVLTLGGDGVRIDQPGDDDEHPDTADAPQPHQADAVSNTGADQEAAADRHGVGPDRGTTAKRQEAAQNSDASVVETQNLEYRATVDAVFRTHAIDQGYTRVKEIEEKTITPAMRRIEAEDPDRHLAGLDHRLKGKDRLTEKVTEAMTERSRTVDEAFATVKDAIRYTFCYPENRYTEGVFADCDRLAHNGFEPIDRRNSWAAEEYKGINSRWRVPDEGQLFEVQFHTRTSLDAKEETHGAYEKLRDPATVKAEQEALSQYQRDVSARIPIPPGALDIPDYR